MSWEDTLQTQLTFGDVDDISNLYVQCQYNYLSAKFNSILLSPLFEGDEKLLQLVTIYIPPNQRRKGLCTRIIDLLEQRAIREGLRFAIGPMFEDEEGNSHVGHIAQSRGYKPANPFSYLRVV